MSGRIFVIAGEASGDALAGDLIAAVRARDAGLAFAGVGGPAMAAQGVASAIDIAPLSVLGIVEGVWADGDVVRAADAAAEAAARVQPDAV
ncbi:MAG: lipid-A-disaccharide synthase, partial [Hyphomonadaceae bacterium]